MRGGTGKLKKKKGKEGEGRTGGFWGLTMTEGKNGKAWFELRKGRSLERRRNGLWRGKVEANVGKGS